MNIRRSEWTKAAKSANMMRMNRTWYKAPEPTLAMARPRSESFISMRFCFWIFLGGDSFLSVV